MGIFSRWFRGSKDSGPFPTRKLSFQYAPIPENGVRFSEQFRAAVQSNEKVNLDFSVESLKFVDDFLQKFKDEGLAVNDFAETIFICGCYVGEVMVHNTPALWISPEKASLPEGITTMPLIIQLPKGIVTDPIAKAFKRFYNGEVDSILYYYEFFTSEFITP